MGKPTPKTCPRCGNVHHLPGPYCADCCDKRVRAIDEGWTSTPPKVTEPGYYWAIPWNSRGDRPEVVRYDGVTGFIDRMGITRPYNKQDFRLWHPKKIEEPPR